MTEKSSEFSDLLLPKELLKPFRDVEEEYLGPFISGQACVHISNRRKQECVAEGLSERERLSERKKITKLLSKPCGCGNDCQKKFTVSEILDAREDFRQLSRAEQHSFIIGKLQSFIHGTGQSESARTSRSRQRQRFDYCITADRPVCRKFFLLYYGESIDRLKRLQKYLIETGTVPPAHGNTGKKPKHACSRDAIEAVLSFISNFAAIHGLPDPGRDLRVGKGKLTIYLPTIMNYMAIHRIYRKSMEAIEGRVVEYHTFRRLWVDNFPHIVFSKTKSDLCMTCEEHKKQINITVAAGTEEEKLEALEKAREHLLSATKERTHYRQCIEVSRQSYPVLMKGEEQQSKPDTMHYSWDFAQQVHYPYEDHQVGPIYFKTPRTAQLFGVCCEAQPRQINYLIDEADFPGKGADTVISMLHHFFACYGLGERHLLLTADNCTGQNKNNAVLHYLLYRTITGLHAKIDWSFMLVGHTKFSPDAYFGLLKKQYRRSRIYTYRQLIDIINSSTVKGCNVCHPYRENDGSASFKYRAWSKWLAKYFRKLPGISNYHHFSMDFSNPGVVTARRYVDSEKETFELLKKTVDSSVLTDGSILPEEVIPAGLSAERQWYLYDKIREHIPDPADKDATAPLPVIARPTKKLNSSSTDQHGTVS